MSEKQETPREIEALRYGVEFIRNDVAYKSTVEAINSVEVKYRELVAAAKAALETFRELRDNDVLVFDDGDDPYAQLESAITKAEKE